MKHFLPGVQGEAKVCPSLASVPVSLSEHLWVGVEKPSREVPSSQSHALRQRPDKTWFVPPFITACSPFPEIVCMLWMASLGIPGGPAEAWDVLVAVPRWLTSGLCFQGGVGSLPSHDGEHAAQLGEKGWVTGGLELPGAHPAPVAA